MHRQLEKYLANGRMDKTKCIPLQGSNPFCSAKKEGTLCMCIDFRILNKQTKIDAYLIPWIDEILGLTI